jgi:hypothetical protein
MALRYLVVALVLTLAAALLRAEEPGTWEVSAGGAVTAGSAGEISQHYSALYRWVLPFTAAADGWRAAAGIAAEDTRFGGDQGAASAPGGRAPPDDLRSVAAELAVEYWRDGEVVATVQARPGEYYEQRPSAGDWDVPIEAWSAIPLPGLKTVSGALGIETARFYHHPIPIVGAVWTLNPMVRIEALYPEPALVLTPNKDFSARFGGELIGGGYLARSLLDATPVEYYAYRVGLTVQWKSGPINFSVAAGDEVEREFDFFRQQRRIYRGGRVYAEFGITWRH